MKQFSSILAGLALGLLSAFPAHAESSAYTPANLKIQNSHALLERYLPPPLHDPLRGEEPESLPSEELIQFDADVEETSASSADLAASVGIQESVETLELSLQAGRLSTSVAQALRRAKLPYEPALQMAFQSETFPRQVDTGDKLVLKFGPGEDGGEQVLQGLQLHLASEAAPIRMYRFVPAGQTAARYFDAQGYEYASRILNSPIDYISISSFLGDGRNHKGLDLRAKIGTPIHTPFRAQVERINWYTSAQGRCVQVVYVDLGIRAKFFHLSEINEDVVPGKMLEPGELFALSGNTGRSTGPHLHYQLEDVFTDEVLDPLDVHGYGAPRLANADRAILEAQIAALETAPATGTEDDSATARNSRGGVTAPQ